MADFNTGFNIVVSNNTLNETAFEGVYSDDPQDPAGLTVYGLQQTDDADWNEWNLILAVINKSKSDSYNANVIIANTVVIKTAKTYHKAKYWDKMKLDNIADQTTANELYSAGLNIGLSTASKMFQQVLNCIGYALTVDGSIGSKTIAAYNSIQDKTQVLKRYAALHLTYYTNKGAGVFQGGWYNRVVGVSGL